MNEPIIILCVFAIVVVVADAVVRLVLAPRRRDRFLEGLMDSLIAAGGATQDPKAGPADAIPIEQLSDNLFRHFEQSATSRSVLEVLAIRNEGLNETGIVEAVNHGLAQKQNRELPQAVVRKIIMVLLRADMIALRQGSLRLTDAGRQLNALLQTRAARSRPSLAFVSP